MMPKKRPKRPRDANQLAKRVVDVATGAEPDVPEPKGSRSAGMRTRPAGRPSGARKADAIIRDP